MKILIVSDTHRKDGNLYDVIKKEKPLDMLIHLGDAEGSEHVIVDWLNEGCELVMVQGNNDFLFLAGPGNRAGSGASPRFSDSRPLL